MEKKKIVNWVFLLIILIVILLGVKWADSKRNEWIKKHQQETPADANYNE